MQDELKEYNLTDEKYRHYTIHDQNGTIHGIHIENPVSFFYAPGHQFHRVWNGSIVTLAPAPGPLYDKCNNLVGWVELAWCPKDKNKPVAF